MRQRKTMWAMPSQMHGMYSCRERAKDLKEALQGLPRDKQKGDVLVSLDQPGILIYLSLNIDKPCLQCEDNRPCFHCVEDGIHCVDVARKGAGEKSRVKRACANCRSVPSQHSMCSRNPTHSPWAGPPSSSATKGDPAITASERP